ncbi:TPA: flagellar export chaperone FliS [Candidatus Galligastranaerophilus faecipullorum]|nr:flagellar export chaperone FliS [Candidatus Galligastranaerophilus faecipullorum]
MNQYVKQYQKTTVETASNEKILIMLYDGAIQFLNKAKIALNEKNYEQSHNNLMGAQRILEEFINTIDKEPNPELANNLINLYEYFIARLVQANIKHEIGPIDEVLKFLKDLKSTWEQAISIAQKERAELISKARNTSIYEDSYDSNEDDGDDEDDDE